MVEKTKATLMVGFNRRFDPHFAAVRKAIDDGAIGTVEMVTITSRDPGARADRLHQALGGIFRDMTIHDFDMARFLLGEEPVAVSAHASVLVDKKIGAAGDFDSVSVILENRFRQAGHHLQLAPRHLWLRPAHRGAWFQRHDRGREPAAGVDRTGQREGLYAPAAARLLHDALSRRLCQ